MLVVIRAQSVVIVSVVSLIGWILFAVATDWTPSPMPSLRFAYDLCLHLRRRSSQIFEHVQCRVREYASIAPDNMTRGGLCPEVPVFQVRGFTRVCVWLPSTPNLSPRLVTSHRVQPAFALYKCAPR